MAKRFSVGEWCGLIALGLTVAAGVGSAFTYAYALQQKQEVIIEKLDMLLERMSVDGPDKVSPTSATPRS